MYVLTGFIVTAAIFVAVVFSLALKPRIIRAVTGYALVFSAVSGLILYGTGYARMAVGPLGVLGWAERATISTAIMFVGKNDYSTLAGAMPQLSENMLIFAWFWLAHLLAFYRYAIHMVINRSNIVTGKRLAEGTGAQAKRNRANRVRTMDKEWGLKQVEEGVQNSKVHAKQPSKIEKEIASRGVRSYKTNLRELCRIAARRAGNLVEYRELLEGWGVDTQFRRGRMYVTDMDNARYSFSVTKLDAALNPAELERTFQSNAVSGSANGTDRVETLRAGYLAEIRDAYLSYRRQAQDMKGTTLSKFPKLKLHRPPEAIAGDPEVRRTILAYWRGADELRVKLASDVPYARRQEKHGETTSGTTSAGRGVTHETRNRKQER